MGTVQKVELPIVDAEGRTRGTFTIHQLPKRKRAVLYDLRDDVSRDPELEPVQVVEGEEYRYRVELSSQIPDHANVSIEPSEVFEPDTEDGHTGRLRPRLYTGMLPVVVWQGGEELGRLALEVRSRKLDYLLHYRWMLSDIASHFTEALMERFAASEQRFRVDDTRDAETLYQRFMFLKSLITGDEFETAIRQILSRPHRIWVEEEEHRPPGRGMPAGSGVARQIAGAPGPRVLWSGGPAPHIPARMVVRRTEETLDTPENRFVKHALVQWRELVARIGEILTQEDESGPLARGRREVSTTLEQLDALLSAEVFREVGPMVQLPSGSQVLQKRAGYREIFRAYIQTEAAAALTWEGGADVYHAGQRDVATLYEYWVFLQLAKAVRSLCTEGYSEKSLFEARPDRLTVALKQGRQRLVTGVVSRHGRRMRVELWYNRGFGRKRGHSWTVPMRPDCSLCIRPEKGEPAPFEPVWLHFDAKYRIEALQEILGELPAPGQDDDEAYLEQEEKAEKAGSAKRSDLLKMHAYRDAIRRSAGAYVVYPGWDTRDPFKMYDEILPGLGAFPLRPGADGEAEGLSGIQAFLNDVLDHVASQASQHERGRYWLREAYDDRYRVDEPVPAAPFLTRPPADTLVLLGYVRGREHLEWIHKHRLYNLRAGKRYGSVLPDSKELAVELAVLYSPQLNMVEVWRVVGRPEVLAEEEMRQLGYPKPNGPYYCLQLEGIPPQQLSLDLTVEKIQEVRERIRPHVPLGLPLAIRWLEFVR